MPTYQYACTKCEHAFDQFQSFSDDSLTVCPECTGRLRKVFNAVGVVFKGSGFYRTDNRPEVKSSTETAGSDASSESSKPDSPKSDSPKSDSKSDSSKSDSSKSDSSKSDSSKSRSDRSRSDRSRSERSSGDRMTRTGPVTKKSDSPAA